MLPKPDTPGATLNGAACPGVRSYVPDRGKRRGPDPGHHARCRAIRAPEGRPPHAAELQQQYLHSAAILTRNFCRLAACCNEHGLVAEDRGHGRRAPRAGPRSCSPIRWTPTCWGCRRPSIRSAPRPVHARSGHPLETTGRDERLPRAAEVADVVEVDCDQRPTGEDVHSLDREDVPSAGTRRRGRRAARELSELV